jgi:hypothetical protein
MKKMEEADKSARAALQADTQHHYPDTYRLLASILVARNQVPAACDQLEKYLKLFPRGEDALTVQTQLANLKASLPPAKK